MNKESYRKAYRYARLTHKTSVGRKGLSRRKNIKQKMKSENIGITDYLYAQTCLIHRNNQFDTVYPRKHRVNYSEYNPVQVWNDIKSKVKRDINETYKGTGYHHKLP